MRLRGKREKRIFKISRKHCRSNASNWFAVSYCMLCYHFHDNMTQIDFLSHSSLKLYSFIRKFDDCLILKCWIVPVILNIELIPNLHFQILSLSWVSLIYQIRYWIRALVTTRSERLNFVSYMQPFCFCPCLGNSPFAIFFTSFHLSKCDRNMVKVVQFKDGKTTHQKHDRVSFRSK